LYNPDTTVNYEVGYKSAWFDSLLTWNISLFYIDWKNIQVGDLSAGGSFPITINGNDAKSQGIETDIQTQIGDHWLLRSAYSYTNAELTQDAPQLVDGTAQSGDRLPGSPEHQGSVIVTYMHQVGGGLDINVDYGITAQSDVYTKVGMGDTCCRDFGEALPGFALSHAAVSVAGDRWEARLYSDNLFDRYAETGVRLDQSFLGSTGPSQDFQRRSYFKYMATPRTIGIDFRYKIK
jgi:outer membrane receptor protein involved in Fe transport